MDKPTRNLIQRATQEARRLLEAEFSEQLEGTFDMLPDGTILSEPGRHLDDQQRLVRHKLVAAIAHKVSAGRTNAEAMKDSTREAAFTFLNRFVALKMLEGRGLVQECISQGDQSSGFKEFSGLAPGLSSLPDHGYRLYLECLFDELSTEIKVLFDRRDVASLLWPRRQALLELLAILNRPELNSVWSEDETIGWVYQYFNSDEERRQMRAESQTPRNSHELAVRNQFFTPRYVVEFLTDNTLGRTWYEMRRGETKLAAQCRYLVRRSNEVFLAEGEELPDTSCQSSIESNSSPDATPPSIDNPQLTTDNRQLTTDYIPFQVKKDPRDLKILDPACGSGHFLLYAFDLLLMIYEEGWTDETAPPSSASGKTLGQDYASFDELCRDIPGLVLRHNLHGIDIDARCAQIAALALWMRAQRAYNEFGIGRGDRAPISKTNIVVAEPMPGEKELRQEFVASLDNQLGQLVEGIFEKMELAGEAGSLLKIEDEIQSSIRNTYGESGELFRKSDEERWREAEEQLLGALCRYAEQAQNGRAYRRRLFAEDAARGLAFIDLCRQRYDVVLMNPPFGLSTKNTKAWLARQWPITKSDLFAAMIERSLEMICKGGRLGAITTRAGWFLKSLQQWREEIVLKRTVPIVAADLGVGVLDGAMVETAAYCLEVKT